METLGEIKISPLVIETITKLSTLEVEGVADLSGNFVRDITGFLNFNSANNGIKVVIEEKEVIIDISITMKNGYSIPELAEKIQENVKQSVENMTRLNVQKVNLHINDIEF